MTEAELKKANELQKKVKELEYFIGTVERSPWTSAIMKKRKFYLKRLAWGWVDAEYYELDRETKEELLRVLKIRLRGMKRNLENL